MLAQLGTKHDLDSQDVFCCCHFGSCRCLKDCNIVTSKVNVNPARMFYRYPHAGPKLDYKTVKSATFNHQIFVSLTHCTPEDPKKAREVFPEKLEYSFLDGPKAEVLHRS